MITLGAGLHPNVPFESYHDNCCAGPSVSGSVLFRLHETCPARALATHYLSPWPREDDDTEDKSFGAAAHCYLIEGKDAFAERYAVKPEDMSFSTKEGKAWKAEHEAKEIVTFKQFEKISGMAIGLTTSQAAMTAFTEGAPEVTAIWQDRETGIWLKARPDYLRPKLAINYKTTKGIARKGWTYDALKYGYHCSAALCVDILKELGEPAHYAFLCQEKQTPYLAKVRVLDDIFLESGRIIYRRALRKFADCISAGKWPGYGDDIETVAMPAWAEKEIASIEMPL